MRRGIVWGIACSTLLGAACLQAKGHGAGAYLVSSLPTQPANLFLLAVVVIFAALVVLKLRA